MVGEMPNYAVAGTAPARMLKPAPELRAGRSAASSLAVESALEPVVDVDRLGVSATEPGVEERPLPAHIELRGIDALERASLRGTAGPAVVRDVDVPARLMAAVVVDGSAAFE